MQFLGHNAHRPWQASSWMRAASPHARRLFDSLPTPHVLQLWDWKAIPDVGVEGLAVWHRSRLFLNQKEEKLAMRPDAGPQPTQLAEPSVADDSPATSATISSRICGTGTSTICCTIRFDIHSSGITLITSTICSRICGTRTARTVRCTRHTCSQ